MIDKHKRAEITRKSIENIVINFHNVSHLKAYCYT